MEQEFVTLPREVVERALAALDAEDPYRAAVALRAALEQTQDHVPDARNMVPAGWKLVPIEPTYDMLYDIQEFSHILPPRGKRIWAHMLAAAPQPPTTEQSSAVEQPQGEQEPVAWVWFDANEKPCNVTFGGPNINTPKDWGVSPLYTHPQPKRNPLDVEEIHRLWDEIDGWFNFARAIEAAHNIK